MSHLPLLDILDTIKQLGWGGAVELFRNGLVLGSLYALIALGYTMVYGILKLLNFAHGEIYMVGAFLGYGVLSVLGGPLAPTIAIVPADPADVRRRDARRRGARASSSSASLTARCGMRPGSRR